MKGPWMRIRGPGFLSWPNHSWVTLDCRSLRFWGSAVTYHVVLS